MEPSLWRLELLITAKRKKVLSTRQGSMAAWMGACLAAEREKERFCFVGDKLKHTKKCTEQTRKNPTGSGYLAWKRNSLCWEILHTGNEGLRSAALQSRGTAAFSWILRKCPNGRELTGKWYSVVTTLLVKIKNNQNGSAVKQLLFIQINKKNLFCRSKMLHLI